MKRRDDWEIVYYGWMDYARTRPFHWGLWDCVLAAATCVYDMTGEDPARGVRGSYNSLRGALRVIKERGGFEAMVTRALGEPIPVSQARRGDVVAVPVADYSLPALGICAGARSCLVGLEGAVTVPTEMAIMAWAV